ncbi:response regulator transcription factor [Planctomycetota bacterium]
MSSAADKGDSRPRILIIDDEPDLVMLLSDLLRARGFEPVASRDGLDGIIDGLDDPIDLVIIDIMMPYADGISVLNIFKAVRPEVPAIILTGKTTPDDIKRGYEWGCDAYVTKPFDHDHLVAEINRLLQPAAAAQATGPDAQ